MPEKSERERITRAALLWKKRPARQRRVGPTPQASAAIEARYSLALRQQVRGFVKRVKAALEPILRELAREQRQDADPADKAESTIARLRREFRADTSAAKPMVTATGEHNTEAMNRMVAPVTGGIPIWKGTTAKDRKILSKAVTDNVRLIKTIPDRLLDGVEKDLRESWAKGSRVETIRDRLQERYQITERQADLIARDQVLKLNAQLVEQRSLEQGIKGYTWRTSLDERVRETHQDLEATKQTWDDPPVSEKDGSRNHPGEAFNCLPGDAEVCFPGAIYGAFRRRYSGELTEFVSASGVTCRTTPNHPILTDSGWKPAKDVDVSNYVFEVAQQVGDAAKQAIQKGVRAADCFTALVELGAAVRWNGGHHADFHGDASVDQEVQVVSVERGLFDNLQTTLSKRGQQLLLPVSEPNVLGFVPASGAVEQFPPGSADATNSVMGGPGYGLSILRRRVGEAQQVRLRAIANIDPQALEMAYQSGSADPVLLGYLKAGLAGEICLNGTLFVPARVVSTARMDFDGWVYNFDTHHGVYTAQNILQHNCRCTAEADIEGLLDELGI